MDEERPQGENKGWFKTLALLEVGGFELVFVLVFLVLFFGTLNYFNILSISTLYPEQLGFLPHRPFPQTIQKIATPSPTPDFSSNPLVSKAKSIGYNIIWMDPKDTVGRTVFYEDRKKTDYNFRGIGIILTQSTASPSSQVVSYISGKVVSLEKIDKSEDEYINLVDPQAQKPLPKIRLIFTKNTSKQAGLIIENLSYGPKNPYDFNKNPQVSNLGFLSTWDKEKIKKIIKSGDGIIIAVTSRTKDNQLVNEKDQNNQFIATVIIIRRFDGRDQLNKELKRS